MKVGFGYGSQKFRLSKEGKFKWYHKDAKNIKRGITYRHMLNYYWTTSVDTKEIYSILEKDKTTITHWLVEHKILHKENKLEFKPLDQVYLDELVDQRLGYWTVKLSKSKTIMTPKEYKDFIKKLEEEYKKKK
jgi:uncharacterized protein YutE (UPF0331/DUF86 family)